MRLFEFKTGNQPLVLSIPHGGTWIPEELAKRFTAAGLAVKDTDWFLPRLYDFEELTDASVISANVTRYVVDLNRSSDNADLYPGQNTTGLCPAVTFAGLPIYNSGPVTESEIATRVQAYWRPYHKQLQSELERLIERFGYVVLLDGHSIASEVPRLFAGRLPDFNFGTNHGKSCSPLLQSEIEAFAGQIKNYTSVVNGRFVGGQITRGYGAHEKIQAVQLELSQITYMNEADLTWDDARAAQVQPVLRSFVNLLREWITQHEDV